MNRCQCSEQMVARSHHAARRNAEDRSPNAVQLLRRQSRSSDERTGSRREKVDGGMGYRRRLGSISVASPKYDTRFDDRPCQQDDGAPARGTTCHTTAERGDYLIKWETWEGATGMDPHATPTSCRRSARFEIDTQRGLLRAARAMMETRGGFDRGRSAKKRRQIRHVVSSDMDFSRLHYSVRALESRLYSRNCDGRR